MAQKHIEFLNPEGLYKNPAYSQLAVTQGITVYIGGKNGVSADGKVVGKGDIRAQAEQTLKNITIALEAGGVTLADVVKWNVYLKNGENLMDAYEVFKDAFSSQQAAPLVTVLQVCGFANPDFLLEIDAIAIRPSE